MTAHDAALALFVSALLAWGCGGPTAESEPSASPVASHGGEDPEPPGGSAYDLRFDLLAVERGRVPRSPGPLARNPFRFGFSNQQSASTSFQRWRNQSTGAVCLLWIR